MSDSKCIALGTPESFGGNKSEMLVLANSSPGGIKDVIDTCDLETKYGIISQFSQETTADLFKGTNKATLSAEGLQKRLSFYKEYPKVTDLAAHKASSYKSDKKTFIDFLDWYYAKLSTIHAKYDVPFVEPEISLFGEYSIILLLGTAQNSPAEGMNWLCSSPNVPKEIFASFITEIAIEHLTSGHIDLESGRLQEDSFLGQCRSKASPARQTQIDSTVKLLSGKFLEHLPKPPKVGDTIDIPIIRDMIRGKKAAVLFFWSPSCGACKTTLSAMVDLDNKIRASGGAVIGFTNSDENTSRIQDALERFQIQWPNVSMDLDSFSRLTMDDKPLYTSVPTMIVVDANGEIKSIAKGSEAESLDETKKTVESLLK
jgi:peroxiredoxin